MESAAKTKKLRIGGMVCMSCQNKIEKKLRNIAGIKKVEVNYSDGTAVVTYDTDIISFREITAVIQRLDYKVLSYHEQQKPNINRIIGLLIIIVSLYAFLEFLSIQTLFRPNQLAETNMRYGMLFVIGFATSVHCIAMCGGINLSQCIPKNTNDTNDSHYAALYPAFLYNLGRVVSYTGVGFIVGALGSVITFSNTAQGVLKLAAGVCMVMMGINMLDIFPCLRKLHSRIAKVFVRRTDKEKAENKSPFIVGLLNGFMPCGPLQAMQIYALSTGNPITGAYSMMLFSLGTVPLMFGLGAISSVLGRRFRAKITTAGAVLVAVLGLSMLSQGWHLSGIESSVLMNANSSRAERQEGSDIVLEDAVQIVSSTLSSSRYPTITVQTGMPVKWIIDVPKGSINGCNNRIFIKEYELEHMFTYGENVITFTPTKAGSFKYSCWMGMIRGTIHVVDELETIGSDVTKTE